MRPFITLMFICLTAIAVNAQRKPNVVIMLADNVGYGDIGAYGAGEMRGMPTARIDSIATSGLRLTQYLVEPACTPSRAALMSGRYSVRLGLTSVIAGGTPNTLQASEITLGELFNRRAMRPALPASGISVRLNRAGRRGRVLTSTRSAFSNRPTARSIAKR